MKLILNKNQLGMTPEQWLRRAGYAYIRDRERDVESFVRRLGNYHYPRLHMYVSENNGQVILNLHLDQKQASYQGSHMHNAEYDGEVVETEIARLKKLVPDYSKTTTKNETNETDLLNTIKQGEYEVGRKKEKKSWWRKIFNL